MVSVITMLFATSCKKEYTITVQSNNNSYGTVSGGGEYKKGTTATLVASPNTDYIFVGWQDNNTENPRKVEVNGNATYIATFMARPNNPADDFVGTYALTGTIHATLPIVGEYSMPMDDTEATIELSGNDGDVLITVMDRTVTAHVTQSGMVVEPMVIPLTIESYSFQFTATFPLITKPTNGVSQFQVQISATYGSMTVPGTVDVTATRLEE